MQTERRTKQIDLFFMPRCSLAYQKTNLHTAKKHNKELPSEYAITLYFRAKTSQIAKT